MRLLSTNRTADVALPLLLLFGVLASAVVTNANNVGAIAAKMDTCEAQAACLKVEAIVSPTWKCSDSIGSCEYEACLMIKGPDDNCPESVSHVCDKPVEMCNHPLYNETGFPTTYNNEQFALKEVNVSGQRYMCQMVGPNAMVEFLIKDGNGCSGSSSSENPVTIPTSFGTYATCEPRPAHVKSCTNDSPGQECVWRYYTPPCPAPVQEDYEEEEEEEQQEKRRELILAEDEPTSAPWSAPVPAPGEFIDQNGCKVNIDIVEDPDTGLATTTTLTECETCDCP